MGDSVMGGMEGPLSDDAVEDMVDFISSLNPLNGPSGLFGPGRRNEGASKADMDQCKNDIIQQRVQMATFLEKNCQLEEKVRVLEKESGENRSEIGRLKGQLESEKIRRGGMETKILELDGTLRKVITVVESLLPRMTKVEKTIKTLEAREATPPPQQSDEALEVLTTLSNEIQTRLNEVDGTQARATEEIRKMKETVEESNKRAQSKASELQQKFSKVDESQARVTRKLDEFTKSMGELGQQFQLQIGIQARLIEVNENQARVTDEIEQLKETVKELKQQRIRPEPEVQMGTSMASASPLGGIESDDDNSSVIIIDDEDDEGDQVFDEPKLEPESSVTLSSVASNFRVNSANVVNRRSNNSVSADPPPPASSSSVPKTVTHALAKITKTGVFCICSRRFSNQMYFRAHIYYHTADKKFQCSLCPERFVAPSYLKKHLIGRHKVLPEAIATRHYYSTGQLNKAGGRVRNVTSSSTAKASTSGTTTTNVSKDPPPPPLRHHGRDFARHLFCLCGRNFRRFCDLNKHLVYHTAEKKYICKACGKGFSVPSRLNEHLKRSAHVRPRSVMLTTTGVAAQSHKCCHCRKTFKTLPELGRHLRLKHKLKLKRGNNPTVTVDADGQEHKLVTHPLPLPGSETADVIPEDNMDPNRFYCVCGKNYSSKQRIALHMKLVVRAKAFACSHCPSRFDVHYDLKKHVRSVHKMEYSQGKFACSDCGETFETRMDFNTHRFAVHDEQK